MENKDIIIEQILSVEDFDNVDEKLMEAINGDDEYRRIFEECREISGLASECVPEPEKDGVTLHDAVMNRVSSGDTAPRYINTSGRFRFPFATAASVAVILVVALTVSVTTRMQGKKQMNNAEYDTVAEEAENNVGSRSMAGGMNAVFRAMPEAAQQGADTANEKAIDDVVTERTADAAKGASSEKGGLSEGVSGKEEPEGVSMAAAKAEAYSDECAEPEEKTRMQSVNSSIGDSDDCEEAGVVYDVNDGGSAVEYDIDEAIASMLAYAEGYSIPDGQRITMQDVERYGKENFAAWFESIRRSDDFEKLYGIDEFVKYCEGVE